MEKTLFNGFNFFLAQLRKSNVTQKNFLNYLFSCCVVGLSTVLGFLLSPYVDHCNLIMLYLLGVVVVATWEGEQRGPSIIAALLSTLAFDFFFIPPFFSFAVSDLQYLFTLIVMLLITQLISQLTTHIRRQADTHRKMQIQMEAERMRNILLSSISHDLRTPLTAIMGSASSLLEHKGNLTDELIRELAKNIYDESKRLNHLVTNVLQLIRLEAGGLKISRKSHSIEEIIARTLEILGEQVSQHVLQIKVDRNLPMIKLDHLLIEQVLANLIENAIKYAPKNSPITISAQLKCKMMVVSVEDKGPGIPQGELEKCFEKFYRSKKSEQTNQGFGLGLAICKNIIQAHGGKIWAENNNSGGAIFNFTLPV